VADCDGEQVPDSYVGNNRLDQNLLWNNQAGEGFKDVSLKAGVKGDLTFNSWGHTIGPSFGDLDGDALIDLVVPNLDHPRFHEFSDPTTLYYNNGDGTFTGFESQPFEPTPKGVIYDETHSHSVLFDIDNDGDLDLFLTSVYEGRRSYLYENDGAGVFADSEYKAGIRHFNGWGAAFADVDGDGDGDLVANRLFRNELAPSNYLKLKLVGGAKPGEENGLSNRDAIDAVVTVQVGDSTILRQVEGRNGVGCQNSSVLHFGLGKATQADLVTIQWPSGEKSELKNVAGNQILTVEEAED